MAVTIASTAFVLAVPDAEASARWWIDELGFELALAIESWRFVRRGACEIRLGSCPNAPAAAAIGDHSYFAYIVVDDVETLVRQIGPSVERLFALTDRPWGFREIGLRTPDGHRFMLAQPIS
ncbi:VOC family protein [uncultured Sphingomonas sp.]|uniref:VOC family protein n=1 Tax=uncultured Sphingomonas sp. TaxID=158754 RepID=UPI0035CB0126